MVQVEVKPLTLAITWPRSLLSPTGHLFAAAQVHGIVGMPQAQAHSMIARESESNIEDIRCAKNFLVNFPVQ